MENFIFQNPTKLIFGKGMIGQLAKEIPAGKRILVTFGGGSVRKNGVYDQVKEALKGFEVTEFWGIEANPKIETLRKAIELGKEKKVDYLLAVGGGSVIDGTKLISAGILYECDNELSDDKSQYHLQVGEAAGLYHTRYGYKRNSGDSGTNHGKGDNIPCRFAVADEEAFVIRFMSCYIGDSEKDHKVCYDSNR